MKQPVDFKNALSKWLCYYPQFPDKFSRDLSKRALTIILQKSASDIGLAGSRVVPGTYSKEEIMLQVAILSLLASELVYKDGPSGEGGTANDDFEDEYGDEEDVNDDEMQQLNDGDVLDQGDFDD
jgi:hypothetical protein